MATAARQRLGVFALDENAALAELERAWSEGGYHGSASMTVPGQRSAAPGRY